MMKGNTKEGASELINNDEQVSGTQLSYFQTFKVWLRIGLLSFGGPAAQIALMHREIVDKRKWLSERQYLNALSFCMLLPGPEAMQIATYAGWKIQGTLGGLMAGLLFVLPGAFIIAAFASVYVLFGEVMLFKALFLGVKAAVIIIVIEALIKVAKRALHHIAHWVIAFAAFIGMFFFTISFPIIIAAAALFGFFHRGDQGVSIDDVVVNVSMWSTLKTTVLWLLLWFLPLIFLTQFGQQDLLLEIGKFFSKLAVVTFGGAYAVLAYLSQDVVEQFGWLTASEMMDGLGLAETTPGPLILVNEFVGFLAAYKQGGFWYGVAGASITLWVTFVPCFLWIFVGAPYIEWIGNQARLRSALSAITAAVVGVILNLSLWFALHVLFKNVDATPYGPITLWQPELQSIDLRALLLSLLCAVLLLKYHQGITKVIIISSTTGLIVGKLTGYY